MRQGQQHRRGRGRNNNNNNNRRGHNPLSRSFESNGPDVKVRGTPADIAAKYLSLARDAQSSGDPVLAENYFQHAEHYNRIIMAYREQQQPQDGMNGNPQRFRQEGASFGEGGDDFGDDEAQEDMGLGEQPSLARQSQDPARHMGGEGGQRQHEDGNRPQRQHDRQHDHQQQRFHRHERGEHRFNRHERGERGERPERGERHGNGHGHGHGRSFERPQHDAQSGERQPMERPPFERPMAERPVPERANDEQDHRSEARHEPRHEPRPEQRHEMRHEPRQPRPRPPIIHDEQPQVAPVAQVAPPTAGEGAVPAPRGEPSPRRRERYGLGNDQPEFLRRPVRRPRREPEAPPAGGGAPASDEPPSQD